MMLPPPPPGASPRDAGGARAGGASSLGDAAVQGTNDDATVSKLCATRAREERESAPDCAAPSPAAPPCSLATGTTPFCASSCADPRAGRRSSTAVRAGAGLLQRFCGTEKEHQTASQSDEGRARFQATMRASPPSASWCCASWPRAATRSARRPPSRRVSECECRRAVRMGACVLADAATRPQVVSLGAGFDTLAFSLAAADVAPARFVEVDFAEVSPSRCLAAREQRC